MSSRRRKDELKAARETEARERELARIRHPHDEVHYPSAGLLLVRLIVCASFEHTKCWEVRELSGELLLFRSRSREPDEYSLVGETRLQVRNEDLQELVDGFRAFNLPVFPQMAPFAVADGAFTELILRAGWHTRCHVSWSDGHRPPEWDGLVSHATALLADLHAKFPE